MATAKSEVRKQIEEASEAAKAAGQLASPIDWAAIQVAKGLGIKEIFAEFDELDVTLQEADNAKDAANRHLVQFAMKCGNAQTFLDALQQAEVSNRRGRVPANTSKAEAALFTPLASSYKKAKSQIATAWEAGVIPGSTVSYMVKNTKGEEVERTAVLETASAMNSAKARLKASKPDATPRAGVQVDKDGKQGTVAPIKTDDSVATSKLYRIASAYDQLTEQQQDKVKRDLQKIIDYMVKCGIKQ